MLGLALLTLRKWPPMLAKTMIVFSVSSFFVKKTTCRVQNIIIRAKMIYINNKIIELLQQSHMEFLAV